MKSISELVKVQTSLQMIMRKKEACNWLPPLKYMVEKLISTSSEKENRRNRNKSSAIVLTTSVRTP